MRQLATIEVVRNIEPIEGADSIERIQIKDWVCVSKKGTFQVGDKCVYFEIDSLMPSNNPAFEFLGKGTKERIMVIDGKEYKGYRLRTIKLRGQISQGLALPIADFPQIGTMVDDSEGNDLSEGLGIVKWEAPISAQLMGKIKGSFPSFLRKTDEERVQNIGDILIEKEGTKVYMTEKLDGTSATFYKKDGVFGVCSRNLDLLDTEGNTYWEVAKKLQLIDKLPEGIAIQGEIIGDGIGKNPLKVHGHELRIFNVFNITENRYFDYEAMFKFTEDLGLDMVPIIAENFTMAGDAQSWLKLAEGPSMMNASAQREGIVIRPMIEDVMQVKRIPQRFSFKAISNTYLLKESD